MLQTIREVVKGIKTLSVFFFCSFLRPVSVEIDVGLSS